ncbi:MAG: hypothetical protein LBQ47_05835, partial [Endomicrobium sp.]|nr:hypothetical protein [Endomicrobium sp.]
MPTPVLNEPQNAQPAKPQSIGAPEIKADDSSVKIADMFQKGVNNSIERFSDLQKAYQAMAIKKENAAKEDLAWRWQNSIAESINKMQYGGAKFNSVEDLFKDAEERFNVAAIGQYSEKLVSDWKKSDAGIKNQTIGKTALGGTWLKNEYSIMDTNAQTKARHNSLLAFTSSDYDTQLQDLNDYLNNDTLLTAQDKSKVLLSYRRNYQLGQVDIDINNDPQKTKDLLQNNADYMIDLLPNERQALIKAADAEIKRRQAAGDKENYVWNVIFNNRDNYEQMSQLLNKGISDKKTFDNVVAPMFEGYYGENKKKLWEDMIEAKDKLAKAGGRDEMIAFAQAAQPVGDMSAFVFNQGGKNGIEHYDYKKPLDEEQTQQFLKSVMNGKKTNYRDFITNDDALSKINILDYERVNGENSFVKNTRAVISARNAFYDAVRNYDDVNKPKIDIRKTLGGQAVVRFVKTAEHGT